MKLYCVTGKDGENDGIKIYMREKSEDSAVLRFARDYGGGMSADWTLDDIDEIHEHFEWTIEVEEIRDAPGERAGPIPWSKIEKVIQEAIRTAKF